MIQDYRTIQAERGYAPMWSSGCACPGCGRSQWYIGRLMAECAFCAVALPMRPTPAPRAAEYQPAYL